MRLDPCLAILDYLIRMQLKLTTWNINSVRLRIDLVAKFIKAVRPDILCLQETKCPDDRFPLKRFKRLGYESRRAQRPEGLSRRRVLSRLPFESFNIQKLLRQDRLPACLRGVRRARRTARPDHGA